MWLLGTPAIEDIRRFRWAVESACFEAHITKDRLARLMGIKPQALDQWLTGQRNPNIWKFYELLRDPSGDGQRWLAEFWPLGGETFGLAQYAAAMRLERAARSFVAVLETVGPSAGAVKEVV